MRLCARFRGDKRNVHGRTWKNIRNLETSRHKTYAYTSLTFIKGHAVMSYWEGYRGQLSSRFRSIPVAWFYQTSAANGPAIRKEY